METLLKVFIYNCRELVNYRVIRQLAIEGQSNRERTRGLKVRAFNLKCQGLENEKPPKDLCMNI